MMCKVSLVAGSSVCCPSQGDSDSFGMWGGRERHQTVSATELWVLCVLNYNVWFWFFLFGLQSLELLRQRALGCVH